MSGGSHQHADTRLLYHHYHLNEAADTTVACSSSSKCMRCRKMRRSCHLSTTILCRDGMFKLQYRKSDDRCRDLHGQRMANIRCELLVRTKPYGCPKDILQGVSSTRAISYTRIWLPLPERVVYVQMGRLRMLSYQSIFFDKDSREI